MSTYRRRHFTPLLDLTEHELVLDMDFCFDRTQFITVHDENICVQVIAQFHRHSARLQTPVI